MKKINEEEGIKKKHLWVLTNKSGRKITGHTFFFVCDCTNNPQKIDEDQFLQRKEIRCESCEWIGLAEWNWNRKQVKPSDM